MKIIFCNIAYMHNYIGKTEDDIPKGAGSWVAKNQDAHEKWNFLNVDGYCYGFVMNTGSAFGLERIEGVSPRVSSVDDVTIIWCATKPDDDSGEAVIVGWYENATVYREYQDSAFTPISGLDRCYFAKAKAEDCYLLPEELRTFTIGHARKVGKGKGFGQSNLWYADSSYAQTELIPNVVSFITENKNARINRLTASFAPPENINKPLSKEETELADLYYSGNDFYAFLPYGYREFYTSPNADSAFFLATSLRELHQYEAAITWYKKVTELDDASWDAASMLPYLYLQLNRSEEAINDAKLLLTYKEASDENIRDELRSIISNGYVQLNRISEAIQWLDMIIAESKDRDLVEYTKGHRENLLQPL